MPMRAVEMPMVMQTVVLWVVHQLTMHLVVDVVEVVAAAAEVHQIQVCLCLHSKKTWQLEKYIKILNFV